LKLEKSSPQARHLSAKRIQPVNKVFDLQLGQSPESAPWTGETSRTRGAA
jgi:hypothetical protein